MGRGGEWRVWWHGLTGAFFGMVCEPLLMVIQGYDAWWDWLYPPAPEILEYRELA